MAEYLLSVHHDYDTEFPPLEEMQPVFEAVDRFNQKVRDAGAWVFAGGLMPIQQATTVDNTGDTPIVSDGIKHRMRLLRALSFDMGRSSFSGKRMCSVRADERTLSSSCFKRFAATRV